MSKDTVDDVMPLEPQPGHYQAIINEMKNWLVGANQDLRVYKRRNDFLSAIQCSIEIKNTESWIDYCETIRDELLEEKTYPTTSTQTEET